jgi:hypothetical protein
LFRTDYGLQLWYSSSVTRFLFDYPLRHLAELQLPHRRFSKPFRYRFDVGRCVSILFDCRILFAFGLLPAILRLTDTFRFSGRYDSLRSRWSSSFRIPPTVGIDCIFRNVCDISRCVCLRFPWQLSASFRSRKLDRLRPVSVCF